ncbi:MAG: NAD(P)H-hydrate epimerase, partial [Clostridia bacterium]|nr:NAD(P)H-hydrate epimerase [Clostridia bacterium]
MTPLIAPDAMREMERRFFAETGVRSIDLMETAARALCGVLLSRYGADKSVGFACGPGGNGGDGYACARMYRKAGGRAFVVSAKPPTSLDAAENLRRAKEAGVGEGLDDRPDIWVDALYGTGLSRAPSGAAAALIDRMNADYESGSVVVAVDIPSGLNGATGRAYAPCIRADLTVTFQYAKPGCYLNDGLDAAGEVVPVDIGIPASYYPDGSPALADETEVRAALPPRPRNFHKGDAGHLLIVAGSFGMAGAA